MPTKAIEHALVDDYSDLPLRLREVVARSAEYVDNRQGAKIVNEHCFPTGDRSLETWWLPTKTINGRVVHPTAAVLREAWRRMNEAPERMRGRRPTAVVGIGRGRRRTQADESQRAPPPT